MPVAAPRPLPSSSARPTCVPIARAALFFYCDPGRFAAAGVGFYCPAAAVFCPHCKVKSFGSWLGEVLVVL